MPIKELSAVDDERHVLDPTRNFMREALVWVVPIAEGLGLVAYTWVDAHGRAGTAGIAFGPRLREPVFERVDDVPVPPDMGFDAWKAGPMAFSQLEPLTSQHIEYAGERLAMSFTFEAIHPTYAYTSHPEPFPRFYADDRLEQGGRAVGTARIDGEEITIDGPCHRDHSFGARSWSGTLHYKWINFLAPDVSVHVMDLHGYGDRWIRGYVHRDGTTAEIVDARFAYDLDDAFVHRDLTLVLDDDAGRTTTARLTRPTAELAYPISPRLRLVDVVGEGDVEGTPATVYAEMAWPPDYVTANLQEGRA